MMEMTSRASSSIPSQPVSRPAGDRLEGAARWLDQRPLLIVALLAAAYAVLISPAVHRHLWYDELHTFYIAQAGTVRQFVDEIRLLDLNPPLSYLIVRGSMDIFGPTELGARFPSMVGYFAGSMALFLFVSRRVGALWAAAGVGLFWGNQFFSLSTEARPYAILLAFLGLTLVSWDVAIAGGRIRRWALAGVATGVTGMLLSHVYALLWIAPFWAAEIVRYHKQRRRDWRLWSALTLPVVVCVTYIPLIQSAGNAVVPWWFQGSLPRAVYFYYLIFAPVWPVLLAAFFGALIITIWREGAVASRDRDSGIRAHELTLLVASLFPPLILNLLGAYRHLPFYERHAFLTVLSASALVVLAIAHKSRANRVSGMLAACLVVGFTVFNHIHDADAVSGEGAGKAGLKEIARMDPGLPLVANSALTFLEMDHYEDPAVLARLYYLVDPESSIEYAQSNLTEGGMVMKKYFPIRSNVLTYAEFAKTHKHFLVWGEIGKQQGWLLTKLEAEGADVKEIGSFESAYKDSRLYEVKLNDRV